MWLGYHRSGGLYKLDNYTRKFKKYTELKGIQRSSESQIMLGVFWIGSLNVGLHRLDTNLENISNFLHDEEDKNSICHNSVRATYEDRNRILWIDLGTGGNHGGENGKGGLDRFDPKTGMFKHYKVLIDSTSNFSSTIYEIAEDDNGFLWMDTGGETLLRFDKINEIFKEYHFPTSNEGSKVWLILENGEIFFVGNDFTHSISYQYNIEKDTFFPMFDGYQPNALVKNEKTHFWIATMGQGLVTIIH
ncbi:MAG: streptogramin lyase [Saprospiraceae bacterium]